MTGLAIPTFASEVPGNYLTSALWNSNIYNGFQFIYNRPLFQGYQSAAQSIASTSLTNIAIDTTIVDSYGGHSNVTNNSRYTCQTGAAGWYRVTVALGFVASAAGSRLIEIHKNGSAVKLIQTGNDSSRTDINAALQCTAVIQLAAGDYLEGCAYQTSGGALATNPNGTGMTVIWEHA